MSINWEDGFEHGWKACEERYMEERETLLVERNAARSEVERVKDELARLKKNAERRTDVLNAIKADDGESKQELRERAEQAIKEREIAVAQLDSALGKVDRLKIELRRAEDAVENRNDVLEAIKTDESTQELRRTAEQAIQEKEIAVAERNYARGEAARLKSELKALEDAAENRKAVIASIRDEG